LKTTLQKVLSGSRDSSIRFGDLRRVLRSLGFEERIRGDHHVYTRDYVVEIINLQPRGTLAKPYQVKQVRRLILKYRLADAI